jgi:hypothetical protein
MLDNLIDRLGDWNPQLFRELKSRFAINNLIATITVSILVQSLIVAFYLATQTSFDRQIHNIFNLLNWAIPTSLMTGGVYTITADLNREERQGIFQFIQWTPQSARSIFLGKILGVPSLIYLAILLTTPLHFATGILSGNSLITMLAWYATIVEIAYFCASMVILRLLHHPQPTILLTLLFAVLISIFTNYYNFYVSLLITSNNSLFLSWFYLPIDRNIYVFDAFIIFTLLAICSWQWLRIERRYANPNSTSLSKENSYWINIQFQLWLLGFAIPIFTQYPSEILHYRFYLLTIFYSINVVFTTWIIPLILPDRSSVEDWYHNREQIERKQRHWWQQDLTIDLCWDDRTPIGLAMLIN